MKAVSGVMREWFGSVSVVYVLVKRQESAFELAFADSLPYNNGFDPGPQRRSELKLSKVSKHVNKSIL